MPLARERSRIEAPSYPFLQKTSVAWVSISASRRSKRVAGAGAGAARCRRAETRAAVDGLPIVFERRAIGERSFESSIWHRHPDHKYWRTFGKTRQPFGEDYRKSCSNS